MIVVQSIDLVRGRVEVADLGRATPSWNTGLLRMADRARQVGMSEILIREGEQLRTHARFGNEPRAASYSRTLVLPETYLEEHHWEIKNDWPAYAARFRHATGCLAQLSTYCAVLLTSYGQQSTHLMQLRLALYEICANVVEHGLPGHETGSIDLELRFGPESIVGCVQDHCKRFDPSRMSVSPPPDSAAQRNARGYGIHMIRQLLDDLQHEFNETGNRITFEKRIAR